MAKRRPINAVITDTVHEVKEGQYVVTEDSTGEVASLSKRINGKMKPILGESTLLPVTQDMKESLRSFLYNKAGLSNEIIDTLNEILITPLDSLHSRVELRAGNDNTVLPILDCIIAENLYIQETDIDESDSYNNMIKYPFGKDNLKAVANKVTVDVCNTSMNSTDILGSLNFIKLKNAIINLIPLEGGTYTTGFHVKVLNQEEPLTVTINGHDFELDLNENIIYGQPKNLEMEVNCNSLCKLYYSKYPMIQFPGGYDTEYSTVRINARNAPEYVNLYNVLHALHLSINSGVYLSDLKNLIVHPLNPVYLHFDAYLATTNDTSDNFLYSTIVEMHIKNFGSNSVTLYDFSMSPWTIGLKESLFDNSADHSSNPITVYLHPLSYASLTDELIAAINAKGYTLIGHAPVNGVMIGNF